MISVSAPGKLMLMGEHAVVYGQPCLVTAVNRRLTVTIDKSVTGKTEINAPQVKDTRFVENALARFFTKLLNKSRAIKLAIRSDFGPNLGFGSSSAVTVATIKALSLYYKIALGRRQIFDLAYQATLDVQGVGSGFDLAAATYGGTLYFKTGGAEVIPLPNHLSLVVAYSGTKADTVTMVKKVTAAKSKNPVKFEKTFIAIGKLVKDGREAIESQNWKRLGKLMDLNQEYLRELKVSTPKLETLIIAAKRAGAYGAKLSGAGGGDCMIALCPKGAQSRSAIEQAIIRAGGEVIAVEVGANGATKERSMHSVAAIAGSPVTVVAPVNIAFIKYWGKTDPNLRLPLNNSISMNLSALFSQCTVCFDPKLASDEIEFVGEKNVTSAEKERIVATLDRVRALAKTSVFARVTTGNNFPRATGIASSASGFAALSLAATTAAGLKLSEKELSKFARLSSGSACRSIPDGFVEWQKGTGVDNSYAQTLFPPSWWQICDLVVVVSAKSKKVSSTAGHELSETSEFYKARLAGMVAKIKALKKALAGRNFSQFGQILEAEALNLHAICMTSHPALIYWEPATLVVMKKIVNWRESGEFESYFTIDAGPSVHVICQKKDAKHLAQKLSKLAGVKQVVINFPAPGVHLVDKDN